MTLRNASESTDEEWPMLRRSWKGQRRPRQQRAPLWTCTSWRWRATDPSGALFLIAAATNTLLLPPPAPS